MSRSRNYQRSRSWGLATIDSRPRAELHRVRWEVVDGEHEFYDHAARSRLVYWTAWAAQRIEDEAKTRPSHGWSRRRRHLDREYKLATRRLRAIQRARSTRTLGGMISFTIEARYPAIMFTPYTDGI